MATRKLIWKCSPVHSPVLLLLFLLINSCQSHSQPLINQLAVLLRARPPWPTIFPSNTNVNTNANSNDNIQHAQYDTSSNAFSMDNLQDFSHLNNLIAAQSLGNRQELQQLQYQHQQVDQHGQHNNLVQQLYPLPTAETAASILQAHQQAQSQNGKNQGSVDTKGILIAHPVLGPNQFNPQNLDNKMQNLQNYQNFQKLQTLQSIQKLQQPTAMGDNKIVAAINTGGFYIGPSQPSPEGIQIIKSKMPPPIHHHLHPNQRPITLQQLHGKPPPGGRVIAIPIPSNTPFLIPHHQHPQYQQTILSPNYHQLKQQPNLVTSSPHFVPSNLISTSKFSQSNTDSSQKPTTAVPTTITPTTETPSTTSLTTTTSATTTTETTTTRRPTRNRQPHFINSYVKTTTQIPRPTVGYQPQTNINNIQEVILNSRPQSVLVSSPSTLVGSFRYPDPPTAPKFQSMNTRYELQNQDVLKSYWTSKNPDKHTSSGNGFYESSISNVSPSLNSIAATPSTSSNSKWKHEDNIVQSSKYEITKDFENFDSSFRPSLQLHSFEDSTSGLKEYITLNPPSTNRDSKSLFSSPKSSTFPSSNHFKSTEAKDLPSMESGFRPFNHYAFINGVSGASTSTTTETSVLNLIRNEFTKDYEKPLHWSNSDPTGSTGLRQERKYQDMNSKRGIDAINYYNQKHSNNKSPILTVSGVSVKTYDDRYVTSSPVVDDNWKGHVVPHSGGGGASGLYNQRHVTTSSSELFEDWLSPTGKPYQPETTTTKSPKFGYLGEIKNPLECEKFHRFGFCPVTSHYPLEQVASIGSRCSTLLSHLIAPLPKTDVRYDIIVPKNGSHVKGRSAAPSGWSWKTFAGKPVCDTKEVKIVPGWAKNEQGEWLVILQTENWKQEAQISLCTSQGAYCDRSTGQNCETQKAKCVQRFTAQRLVVLDPLNQDRCPVVRSVFLPSACVCLSNDINEGDLKYQHQTSHKKSKRHNKASELPSITSSSRSITGNNGGSYSKVAKGRSLSTSFFNFGLEDLDLDTAADSSTSKEKTAVSLTPNSDNVISQGNNHNKASSSEEGDVPVISVQNPANISSTFMVITEKVSGGEIPSFSESSEALSQQGTVLNQSGNNSSSSSVLGSAFIVSSSSESTRSSIDSNESMQDNT